MQLYVDLDGVLADFDTGYEREFGVRPSKTDDNVDWDAVRRCANFYANLPPMPDFPALWTRISRYDPIVLTGVPKSLPDASWNKRAWVKQYLPNTLMIATRSSEKATYARPGDVLIDDWERYRPLWEKAGGVWITHVSAVETDRLLTEMGL